MYLRCSDAYITLESEVEEHYIVKEFPVCTIIPARVPVNETKKKLAYLPEKLSLTLVKHQLF